MDACIFCKIASGELPADVVYRGADVIAINDLNPQSPSHVLVLPVGHNATLLDLARTDPALAGRLIAAAAELGAQRGGADGYRLVVNTGENGGQTVGHVHIHVLAGRPMSWPPG